MPNKEIIVIRIIVFSFAFISIFTLNRSIVFSQDMPMDLVLACDRGDLEKVKSLIKAGTSVNARCPGSNVPGVTQAAAKGHYNIVKFLILKGADVNLKAIWDQTALMMSCRFGHIRVTKLLLKSKAKVNEIDTRGMSAFSFAVYSGHYIISKLLISKGANIDIKDKRGYTPLFVSKKMKFIAIEKLLKRKGKSLNATDIKSLIGKKSLEKGKIYRAKVKFRGVIRARDSFLVVFRDIKVKKALTLFGVSKDLYSSLHKLQRLKYYILTFKVIVDTKKNLVAAFEDVDNE